VANLVLSGNSVIPAKAGIQNAAGEILDSRFRGNDAVEDRLVRAETLNDLETDE